MNARLNILLAKKRVRSKVKTNNHIKTLTNIGVFFGAVTPISIILGCILMYAYLSGEKATSYFMESISSSSILLAITMLTAAIIIFSGVIISSSLMIVHEIKINNKSLYLHLKESHQDCNKTTPLIILSYSTLMAIIIIPTSTIENKYPLLTMSLIAISIALSTSITTTWIFDSKNKNISFYTHFKNKFYSKKTTISNWFTHTLFLILVAINISSIASLIIYIPQKTGRLGDFQFLAFFILLLFTNFLVNYVYIRFKKHTAIIIITCILIALTFIKAIIDGNEKTIRMTLGLSENKNIIISDETTKNLSLSLVSLKEKTTNNYTINHNHIITKTNENIIIKTSDNTFVSLPKLLVIGEINVIEKD